MSDNLEAKVFYKDPKHRDYMIIEGQRYGQGTIVEFDEFWQNKFGLKYGMYDGTDAYFTFKNNDLSQPWHRSWYVPWEPWTEHIIRIVKPVPWTHSKLVKIQNDTQNNDMFYGWIGYGAAMLVSSLFVGAPILWAAETFGFINYRKKKLYDKKSYADRMKK